MMRKKTTAYKTIVFFLIAMLGISAIQINQLVGPAFAQANIWYVGKGVKPNTYYTYEIQNADINQGQPFLMTIYFKEFNATGKYWVAPTFVMDRGQVFNGTFHLSDLDLTALGSSPIPKEMEKYRAAYATSLTWLSAFVPKPGQSLTSPYWGKIAAIGGSQIAPTGTAKVTEPAGTFDTTTVSWHKGVDNYIYVHKDLPYPVKALTFADVTTGNPPIQYKFDLQAVGTGQPAIPKSQLEIPKPPLTLQTPRGTYYIQLLWDPVQIKAGQDTHFGLIFTDAAHNLVPRVSYEFKVTDQSKKVEGDLQRQHALDGTGQLTFKFPTPGPKNIQITVQTAGSEDLGLFVESATFGVVVS